MIGSKANLNTWIAGYGALKSNISTLFKKSNILIKVPARVRGKLRDGVCSSLSKAGALLSTETAITTEQCRNKCLNMDKCMQFKHGKEGSIQQGKCYLHALYKGEFCYPLKDDSDANKREFATYAAVQDRLPGYTTFWKF